MRKSVEFLIISICTGLMLLSCSVGPSGGGGGSGSSPGSGSPGGFGDLVYKWTKTIGSSFGSGTINNNDVAIDTSGKIYVAGLLQVISPGADFDPDTGTDLISTTGMSDIFLTRYNN